MVDAGSLEMSNLIKIRVDINFIWSQQQNKIAITKSHLVVHPKHEKLRNNKSKAQKRLHRHIVYKIEAKII